MLSTILTFTWEFEQGISIGPITLRYYSLLFALAFIAGYLIMQRIFRKESIPQEWLDTLLTYVVVATVVGARLGHVFFYEWDYYSKNIIDIFKVWEGGLASHGAAIAIIIALMMYSKKVSKKSVFWVLDRAVITIALAGCFIRMGNMANSEIYGAIGNSSIETVYLQPTKDRILRNFEGVEFVEFEKTGEIQNHIDLGQFPVYQMKVYFQSQASKEYIENVLQVSLPRYLSSFDIDNQTVVPSKSDSAQNDLVIKDVNQYKMAEIPVLGVPRYPTQIIESLAYLLIFLVLYTLFYRTDIKYAQGRLFGLFLIGVFGFRFFVEFFKANQVEFEQNLQLNMGQWLSIPLVVAGFIVFFKAKKVVAPNK